MQGGGKAFPVMDGGTVLRRAYTGSLNASQNSFNNIRMKLPLDLPSHTVPQRVPLWIYS